MNYLAHCWLWSDSSEHLAGGIYGDLIHGRDLSHLPAALEASIRHHRSIDRETDAHPVVVALKSHTSPPFRRYAGILIDMAFDHILARDFALWSEEPLPVFAGRVYQALQEQSAFLNPERLPRLRYIIDHDLLNTYVHYPAIVQALKGIGGRLLRPNPLGVADAELQRLWPQIEAAAPVLLKDLREYSERSRAQIRIE